ncbi:hypothetical protein M0805_004330 [Coniferiporia weirii]|nr:hypothetical protein M0805_004330 [Coniferiporia weirii]
MAPPPPPPPLRNRSLTHTPLSPHSLSPPPAHSSPPLQQHHAHEQPGRSRNARAQARHRAKRKAYIEQLEETVGKLQVALSLTPEQALALPAAHANVGARLRVLEADYEVLREYAESLRDLCVRAGVPSPPPLPLPTPAPAPSPLAMHAPPMLSLGGGVAPTPGPPSAQPGQQALGAAPGPASRTFSQPVPYLSSHPSHPAHHTHGAYRAEHMSGSPGPTGKRRRHSGSASGETDASGVYLTPPNVTPPLNGVINSRPPPLTLPTHSPSTQPHSAHPGHPTPPSAKWERTDESPASAGGYASQGTYMHGAMYAADAHEAGTVQPGQTTNGTGGGAMSSMPPPMPVRHASASADLHLPPLVPSLAQHRQAYGYGSGSSGTGHALVHGHGYAEHASANGHAHHGHSGGRTGYDMELVKREDNADDFERARAAHHGVGGNSMHSMSPTTATGAGAGAVVGFPSLHQQQHHQQQQQQQQQQAAASAQRPSLTSLHQQPQHQQQHQQQPQHQQHQPQHQHQHQQHQQHAHQHQHQQYQQQQQQSPHSPYSPVGQQPPFRTGAAAANGSGLAHYEDDARAAHQHQQHQHQQSQHQHQQHQVPTFQTQGHHHGSTSAGSGSGSGASQSQWAAPPPPSSSSAQQVTTTATAATGVGAGAGAGYHHR